MNIAIMDLILRAEATAQPAQAGEVDMTGSVMYSPKAPLSFFTCQGLSGTVCRRLLFHFTAFFI